jgi:hypothetical protein
MDAFLFLICFVETIWFLMRLGGRHLADYGSARRRHDLRWAADSFFSALKRTMRSTLTSRKPSQPLAEAAFKLLAYTVPR